MHLACRGPRSFNHNACVIDTLASDKLEQDCCIFRMQANAPVRNRPANPTNFVGSVNGIASVKEDRIGHRRIVVFFREPFPLKPDRAIVTIWSYVARARRRNRPLITFDAINGDSQFLRLLVDGDKNISA